jgi:formylglycine-generating enzyme required for sulfatase activity
MCAAVVVVALVALAAYGAAAPKTLKTKSGVEMVLLPGGSFTMGDAKGASDEKPHRVSVDAFYIDKYEVTQRTTGRSGSITPAGRCRRARWSKSPGRRGKYCNARRPPRLTPL